MEKMKYETPEMEIMLLDPTMDIITASGDGEVDPGIPGGGSGIPGVDF